MVSSTFGSSHESVGSVNVQSPLPYKACAATEGGVGHLHRDSGQDTTMHSGKQSVHLKQHSPRNSRPSLTRRKVSHNVANSSEEPSCTKMDSPSGNQTPSCQQGPDDENENAKRMSSTSIQTTSLRIARPSSHRLRRSIFGIGVVSPFPMSDHPCFNESSILSIPLSSYTNIPLAGTQLDAARVNSDPQSGGQVNWDGTVWYTREKPYKTVTSSKGIREKSLSINSAIEDVDIDIPYSLGHSKRPSPFRSTMNDRLKFGSRDTTPASQRTSRRSGSDCSRVSEEFFGAVNDTSRKKKSLPSNKPDRLKKLMMYSYNIANR